jgi:glycosyltransferase involved in cell wall biosynthesis
MKIFVSKINESWIVDRVRNEWIENNKEISTNFIRNADIIWIVAPWLWKKIPMRHLKNKIVVCSMYHLDGSNAEIEDFIQRDKYVDYYHVISKNTERQIRPLTEKTIKSIPFWVDDKVFFEIKNKQELKKSLGLDQNKYYIGSFQRDTEGSDLKSPKLIKGPDRFIKIISSKFLVNKKIEVILTGKRRQYVIAELEKIGVPFTYFEMADLKLLNKLYNILDLYIVSSRIEGGPQAIIECGLSKTPIISTDVGVAKEILAPKSIFEMSNFENAETDEKIAYENSVKFNLINGQQKFIDMFLEVKKTFF